jgi:hypothetical protein
MQLSALAVVAAAQWRLDVAERYSDYDTRADGHVINHAADDPPAWQRDRSLAPLAPRVVANVPDPFSSRVHAMRADGTVGRRGRSHVVGSWAWSSSTDESAQTDPRLALANYLARLAPMNVLGQVDGLTLSRAADAILNGANVPALIGTDVMSWEQVVTIPVGAFADEMETLMTALHLNYTDPWDAAREVFGIPRPNTRGAIACAHDMIVRPSTAKRTARRSVTMGRKRAGDPVDHFTTPRETAPSHCHAFGVVALVAPAHDREHRWVGHVLVKRPAVHATRRAATRARVKRAATIVLAVDEVETHAASLAPGTSTRFACDTLTGTIARAQSGTFSVRVKRDDGKVITRSTLRAARYVRNVIVNASR